MIRYNQKAKEGENMQLNYNIEEVLRYLGYKNATPDPQTLQEIKECGKMLESVLSPKSHYQVFDIEKGEEITIKNTALKLCGNSAKNLLADCDKCILMIVTIGGGTDELIRKLQITDMSKAVMTDFCASSLVEDLANVFEGQIKSKILKEGEYFTDRFSPGYGDMPLEIQKTFCDVLEAGKTVGVFLSSGGMMIPKKTITAVIGIANKPQKMKIKGCKYCDFRDNCKYKKEGVSCE